jgi:hypothetical protein
MIESREDEGLWENVGRILDNYVNGVLNLEREADEATKEAQGLLEKAKTASEAAERLRAEILEAMDAAQIREVAAFDNRVKRLPNSLPTVTITDKDIVPDDFVKIRRTIRKDAVASQFSITGKIPPGTIIEFKQHLRITKRR